MEPRRVRLGDVVDDYCPRERRLTGHAVVAMVGDEIRQTRCTACDAEHPYRGGQTPRRRKKDEPGALFAALAAARPLGAPSVEVGRLAGPLAEPTPARPANGPVRSAPAPGAPERPSESDGAAPAPADATPGPPGVARDADEAAAREPGDSPSRPGLATDVEGSVRRPLIRATLPRPEGQPASRPIPEFTMRQPGVRPGRAQGHGRHGSDSGPGHHRPPGSPRAGFHSNRGHAHAHHRPGGAPRGKKRSR